VVAAAGNGTDYTGRAAKGVVVVGLNRDGFKTNYANFGSDSRDHRDGGEETTRSPARWSTLADRAS
jgi:hypothetical protein